VGVPLVLGLGYDDTNKNEFTQIGTDNDWEEVICRYRVTFARKTNGDIYHWGENYRTQLGSGIANELVSRYEPTLNSWKFEDFIFGDSIQSFGAKVAK
jgi:alpha-tubulin suppressor-like RCC1 family protein